MSSVRSVLSSRTRLSVAIIAITGTVLGGITLCLSASVVTAADDISAPQQATTATQSGVFIFPTATPTVVGGPTATPSRTPTPVPVLAEIIGNPTNLRSLPSLGDEYIIDQVSPGLALPVVGRWLGYDWLLVEWANGPDGKAWVHTSLIIVRGDITTVPAVTPPAPPTVDPTQASIRATATVLLQTPGAAQTATATAYFMPTGVFTQPPPGDNPVVVGMLPTFTPPPPYIQPAQLPEPQTAQDERSGVPPAALIISLAAMGVLTLLAGLLRRLF